jgi:hypothetical protein
MAVHVTPAEVQQWIQDSRLTIAAVDPPLESSAYSRVVGALALRYTTGSWTDATTTPPLVRSIISMLVAAWTINKAHAETVGDVDAYGVHLESSAMVLLGGLADGSILVDDVVTGDYSTGQPAFWPTDLATTVAEEEGWDAEGAAPLLFTTGKLF